MKNDEEFWKRLYSYADQHLGRSFPALPRSKFSAALDALTEKFAIKQDPAERSEEQVERAQEERRSKQYTT